MKLLLLFFVPVVLSCCSAPDHAEPERISDTSETLTVDPRCIAEGDCGGPRSALPDGLLADPAVVETWLREHMPRWRAFFANTPYHWSATDRYGHPRKQAIRLWWTDPYEIDAFAPLILVPENADGTDQDGSRWIQLRARRLRSEGDAYLAWLVEHYQLSLLDLLAIEDLLDQDPGAIPVHPMSTPLAEEYDEDEPRPALPLGPEAPDRHTYTGGPPTSGRHQPHGPAAPPPPAPTQRPPLPSNWGVRPSTPAPYQNTRYGGGAWPGWPPRKSYPQRSPNGDPGGYSTRDFLNGLNPDDVPEGMYPGSNDPDRNPSDMEIFKCRGHVYRGYKDMCPDYALLPNKRWSEALGDAFGELEVRGRTSVTAMRRSEACLPICLLVVNAPAILKEACLGAAAIPPIAPPPLAALKAFCDGAKLVQLFANPFVSTSLIGAGGSYWCGEEFCFKHEAKRP